MAFISESGKNAQSASGLGDLMRAMMPLQDMMASEDSLTRELDRTVGAQR
jgi:hypothetical protein